MERNYTGREARLRYFKIIRFLKNKGYSDEFIAKNRANISDLKLRKWDNSIPKPTEEDLDNITEEESKEAYVDATLQDFDTSQDNKKISLFLSLFYKEMSPDTPNKKIRQNIRKWTRQGILLKEKVDE